MARKRTAGRGTRKRPVDWDGMFLHIAEEYKWAPDVIANLTLAQLCFYLHKKDKNKTTWTHADIVEYVQEWEKVTKDGKSRRVAR